MEAANAAAREELRQTAAWREAEAGRLRNGINTLRQDYRRDIAAERARNYQERETDRQAREREEERNKGPTSWSEIGGSSRPAGKGKARKRDTEVGR